jgi:hypothetical protein
MSEFAGSPPRRGRPPKYNSALPQLTNNTAVAIYATIIALMKHKIQTSPLDLVDDELWEIARQQIEHFDNRKANEAIHRHLEDKEGAFLEIPKEVHVPLTLQCAAQHQVQDYSKSSRTLT